MPENSDKQGSPESKIINTTQLLTKAVQEKLAHIDPSETLVMNIGENHANPFHIVAQIDFMENLAKQNIPFVCALEREENKITIALKQFSKVSNIPKAISNLRNSDMFEQFERLSAVRSGSVLNAPLSHALQFHYLATKGIEYHFIDAPRDLYKSDPVFDTNHPKNKEHLDTAERILGDDISTWQKIVRAFTPASPIRLDSTKGSLARNLYMTQACNELSENIRRSSTQLIVLLTGAAHVRGNKDYPNFSPAFHSLAHLAEGENFHYLGTDLGQNQSPHDFHLIQDKWVKTPAITLSVSDSFAAADKQNLTGTNSFAYLKEEERKIGELNLEWLEPYRGKILELYAQNVMDFEDISKELLHLER